MSDEYNANEEHTFRTELFRRMDKQDTILDKVLDQTTKTNGRVLKLEAITSDYDETKKKVSILENYHWWILGFGFSFTILGSSILYFVTKDINEKIKIAVIQALNDKASKIKNEKSNTPKI